MNAPHTSVLLEETIAALALRPGDLAMDLTVGAGGHTERIVQAVGSSGRVIGLDQDETALAIAARRLERPTSEGQLKLVHAAFSQVERVAGELGLVGQVQGIMADIGVSSMHLDDARRGFSFQADGPLDMRMNPKGSRTAADLINQLSESDLVTIFRDYGEEPKARQVARRLVQVRDTAPLTTTKALAELVSATVKYPKPSKKHPATRVFQALRIAVNDELGELERMLTGAFNVLRPGGRLAIISFHSLEDRIVKETFLGLTGRKERAEIPRHLPIMDRDVQMIAKARAEIVKPFPGGPSDAEVQRNPRSRSAKLRVITKL